MMSSQIFSACGRYLRRSLLTVGLLCAPLSWAEAQVTTTWNGGAGIWSDSSKWSGGVPPTGPSADVIIDSLPGVNSAVTIDSNFSTPSVGRLRIDTGDSLDIPLNSRLLSDNTGFTGAGEWLIDGLLTVPATTQGALDGTKTINGSGKIVLGSGTSGPEIYGNTYNNATIEGVAAFGRNNNISFWHPMVNTGTIDANVPNGTMVFRSHPAGSAPELISTNTGTMKASNGGRLLIDQGLWNGAGGNMIADGPNSVVQFGVFHFADMVGGTFSTANGGLLRVGSARWRDLVSLGSTEVFGTESLVGKLTLAGTVTNNGTITVPAGGGRIEMDTTLVNGQLPVVTLAGTGQVVLDKHDSPTFGNNGTANKLIVDGQTIRGRGSVGRWSSFGMEIVNRGTFQADRANDTLFLDLSKIDNQSGGILRAQDDATLNLNVRETIKNTGGTIEALDGGKIVASIARVEGGLIRNFGGSINLHNMTMVNPDADQTLAHPDGGMTLQGTLDLTNGQVARLVKTIRNEGELRVRSTGTDTVLRIGETAAPFATLTGRGTITLGDPANSHTTSGIFEGDNQFTLTNKDNLIHGFGQLGQVSQRRMQFINEGTVSADASGKQLFVHTNSLNNTEGDLRAESGGILNLQVNMPIANVGSLIEARANSTVKFNGGTEVSGGMLRKVTGAGDTGGFELSNATLTNPGSGFTLQGPFTIGLATGARFVGNIRNEGTITIKDTSNSTQLRIGRSGAPEVRLTGGGSIVLNDPTPDTYYGSILEGTEPARLFLDSQSIRGYGLVGNHYFHLSLTNNDLISADENARTLHVWVNNLTNSPGKVVEAKNGGTLSIAAINTTNTGAAIVAQNGSTVDFRDGEYSNRRLYGGTVQSQPGGTVSIYRGLRAEQGVVFDNLGTTIVGHSSEARTIFGTDNGGAQFLNKGALRKIGSQDAFFQMPITNTGTVRSEQAALRFTAGGTMTNAVFDLAGGHVGFTQAPTSTFSGTNNATGTGKFFMQSGNIALADAATTVNTNLFDFYNTNNISGLGTITVAGALDIYPYSGTQTFTGTKLINLAGANSRVQTSNTVRFRSGAQLENRGTFTFAATTVDSSDDTLLTNTQGAVLKNVEGDTTMTMPLSNSGNLRVDTASLKLRKNTSFANGTATIANNAGLRLENGLRLSLAGDGNTISGLGYLYTNGATMNFSSGATLTAERINFESGANIVNDGLISITGDVRFNYGYSPGLTFNNTVLRLEEGATGTSNSAETTTRLNTKSRYEIAGRLDIKGSGTFAGDGTGRWSILEKGHITFHAINTIPYPLHIQGSIDVIAADGRTVSFTKGGLLDRTAKLFPQRGATISLSGAEGWIARGKLVEMNGTGSVQFANTKLTFEDDDPNNPDDNPDIDAGAAVNLFGTNLITGPGTLSTTQFYFQQGNTTVDGSTLETSGNFLSEWNNPGGKLELKNGAKFLNAGQFIIKAKVGQLLNDPGIKGDAGTLFHNLATGRLIHDTDSTTEFGIDFHNDGVLDFRRGTFKFLNKFSGNGGIAASGGAKITINCADTPLDQLPGLFEVTGAGSHIDLTLPNVENIRIPLNINGGSIVAAGGLNMVAAGGMNMVAAGAGNMVAAGGMNMVAAGAGNIISRDGNSLIQTNGGDMVAAGAGNMVAAGAGNMVAAGAGNMVAAGAGNMVAAGAGNMVTAGAGNMVAAGGGNMVAAGAGNISNLNIESKLSNPVAPAALAAAAESIPSLDELTGVPGLEALLAKVAALNTDPNVGVIFAEAGGNAKAENGGSIIAEANGIIAGAGTFTGPGFVKNGGVLMPGSTVGNLTWNGNLNVESGGLLDIEIGGTTAGTQYDAVNVSGTLTLNGEIGVRFLNGFGNDVQSTDTFDIASAGSPISTSLGGTRVTVGGTRGSFAVQLVNEGRTLRLTDYKLVAPTFENWASQHGLSGAAAAMTADPDGDGLANLLEYALGKDPNGSDGSATSVGAVETGGQKYLTLSYTRPTGPDAPSDVTYTPERATTLAPPDWSSSSVDLVTHSVVPGPGSLETVTVRSTHPMSATSREFLHLKVTSTSQ